MNGLIYIILFLCSLVSGGFASMYLWEWFIVPLGVSAISFLHAIGLRMTFSFFTLGYADLILSLKSHENGNDPKRTEMGVLGVLIPLIMLLAGYIYKSLM